MLLTYIAPDKSLQMAYRQRELELFRRALLFSISIHTSAAHARLRQLCSPRSQPITFTRRRVSPETCHAMETSAARGQTSTLLTNSSRSGRDA